MPEHLQTGTAVRESPEISRASACAQEKDNGWPKVLDIYFENNDTVAFSWEEAITVEDTGMYYLWFVICDDELSAATVRGQTTWKNPTGAHGLERCLLCGQRCVPAHCSCCARKPLSKPGRRSSSHSRDQRYLLLKR